MPEARINGVNLYYQVTGEGFPLVLCREFGGDYKSWDPQVKFFSRRYQVITYNARGWPPSQVPSDPSAYSQEQSVGDLYSLLNHLGIQRAFIGGLSIGRQRGPQLRPHPSAHGECSDRRLDWHRQHRPGVVSEGVGGSVGPAGEGGDSALRRGVRPGPQSCTASSEGP